MTRLHQLFDDYGQSPWIDNIKRDWLNDGTLEKMVVEGVRGVTSNPAIFAKAFATSSAYDELVAESASRDPEVVFERLAVADVRDACDVLGNVHSASVEDFNALRRRYCDGFVSLEVSPLLARDTAGTVEAAIRLAKEVSRANVMIKIPATREGLPAIREVLGAGVSVNVTLIFSVERYGEVIDAWHEGLLLARSNGHDIARIASVASFFVSRVDAAVDPMLEVDDPRRGRTANAQVASAYSLYLERMAKPDIAALLADRAQVQRPLWASTSTKDPTYYDLLYVDTIVADETVNTMPDATMAGVLDHGAFESSTLLIVDDIANASGALADLPEAIVLDEVTRRLEIDGVEAFVTSYRELLATVAAKLN